MSTPKTSAPPAVVAIKILLPESLADVFGERAAKAGHSTEVEIVKTLNRAQGWNASAPIYLDDNHRNALTVLAGTTIKTPDDLLAWCRKMIALKVNGVEITLDQRLATRLASRCFGATWEQTIRRIVIESLEEFVGLR